MKPRERDVAAELAGRAHADADPIAKRLAAANGVTPRTAQRWRSTGHNSPLYRGSPFVSMSPQRVLAFREASDLMVEVRGWSKADLIARYHEALKADKAHEAEDNCNAFDPECSWLDAATASQRDAADDLLKAACEQRFAEMGMSRAEVFAGVWS